MPYLPLTDFFCLSIFHSPPTGRGSDFPALHTEMKIKGADACVVGADRVCANGDTANKIGTFALAIIAREMGVDFYVSSPFTTLDVALSSGDDILIEERPSGEMLDTARAPKDMPCWNPGFDVTPAKYITGIITEKGVLKKSPDGTFDVIGFMTEHST